MRVLRPLRIGRLGAPQLGFAVFLASFTLFAVTTSPLLLGYEPETAAVTEGLVERGEPRIIPGSIALSGQRGHDGGLYGRSTLPQPLLEVPFYSAGKLFDAVRGSGAGNPGRRNVLVFFNPFMAALAAAAVFGIVLLRNGSVRWGLVVAAAFSFGSLAWPYSKIGMETTFMSLAAITLFLVLLSLRRDHVELWALTGVVAGAAAISKAYAVVAVAPLFVPLLACVGRWSRAKWLRVVTVVGVPVLAWGVAQLLYNGYRFDNVLSFSAGAEPYSPTLAAPFNFVGFFASPGKGVLLYSPLVVLGLLGLRELWRRDRLFALTIVTSFFALTLSLSGSAHWSDETWGPRYLVPVAWLLLLPIPYWYWRSRRRGTLIAVAVVAVAVQLLAVTVPVGVPNAPLTKYYRGLTGADPFYSPQRPAPFGRDPYRWVPQLSPLVLHADALASVVVEKVTGYPLKVTYAPFLGPRRSVAIRNGQRIAQAPIPDLWWWNLGFAGLFVAGMLAAVAGAIWLQIAMAIRHSTEPRGGSTPVSAAAPTSDREPVV